MNESLKSYQNTPVTWTVTQQQITKMLNERGIVDIQFSSIGQETAAKGGLEMKPNTFAIMILFQKNQHFDDGRSGSIPVRIILPNVPQGDQRVLNQHYRLLYWYLKSKFEAIDSGLVEFAEEFMAHLQITNQSGFTARLWDTFKNKFYRAIGSGEQGNANFLPPILPDKEGEDEK